MPFQSYSNLPADDLVPSAPTGQAGAGSEQSSLTAQGKPTIYQPSTPHLFRVCPDCAGPVVRSSGCISCTQCGWGQCG
jgi:hypothetical protein